MNKLDMSKELKPCPFCGGGGKEDSAGVHCANTDCGAHFLTLTWNQWNTRAQLNSGEWVKCSERMPEVGQQIAIVPESGFPFAGEYTDFPNPNSCVDRRTGKFFYGWDLWYPLPQPPEEK